MLIAHFDESYSKNFMVFGGWIASAEDWDNFEVDWKLFLISYRIPYLHMTDFAECVRPFHTNRWKENHYFRARFVREAWDIIRYRTRKGFVCHLDEVLFNRVNQFYKLKEKFPSSYAFLGRECIVWAQAFGCSLGQQVRCIFHDGGPDKGGLLAAANIRPELPSPTYEPAWDVPDRKRGVRRGIVPLQSADYLAYEMGKFIKDHPLIRSGQKNSRASFRIFGEKAPDKLFFTEQRLLRRCKELAIEERLSASAGS